MDYPRLLQPRLEEALDDTPVVLIHGPRQCGKTTLARKVGDLRGYTYLSFDDLNLVAVDIVMEHHGGGIVAVEVKAAATVTEKDFKGLKKL